MSGEHYGAPNLCISENVKFKSPEIQGYTDNGDISGELSNKAGVAHWLPALKDQQETHLPMGNYQQGKPKHGRCEDEIQ